MDAVLRPRFWVDKEEALRYLGFSGQDIDPELDGRIDQMIERCQRESAPKFLTRVFLVQDGEASCVGEASRSARPAAPAPAAGPVRLQGTPLQLEGADIAAHLAGARAVGVLACTLGLPNEAAYRRIAAGSTTDAALFSAAGSSLVESVANAAEAEIVAQGVAMGLHSNWRFSPGYGDFPLSVQRQLLAALGADRLLGMEAGPSFMIIPTKSITAVIGLFDTPRSDLKKTCAHCVCQSHCTLRKVKPCYL